MIMSTSLVYERSIHPHGIAQIPGITFRSFQGPSDYPAMVDVIRRCNEADQLEHVITEEDIETSYKHLTNCDPTQDMLMVEKHGEMIAYLRVEWQELSDGLRIYSQVMKLAPEATALDLGRILLEYAEKHLRNIAADHPAHIPKFFETGVNEKEADKQALLEHAEYKPNRYFFEMVRDLTQPFPEAALPEDLEIRPATADHYRKIWDALSEAFRDHWGHREHTEEDYQAWINSRWFQPELWKVAWDGDQVVGTVLCYIDKVENETFNRKRGYTEDICVRRPWRRRGVARSLLVDSMESLRTLGMSQSALGVDTQNPNGALRLYLSVGYHREHCHIVYRKPF
jgi:ribosomal protein S18 acetylase RimI-like enzyme